jgi:hypothetical protein
MVPWKPIETRDCEFGQGFPSLTRFVENGVNKTTSSYAKRVLTQNAPRCEGARASSGAPAAPESTGVEAPRF